ncbi:sortilin-related receptor [Plakobranchus ocellatus]|uniref:Sortilin-related receptor n=1 Tax=Plakobranchus ocellatus TaxID=259542 RepID=A0AAV4CEB3_9GAST|nr:sortilin-related receptor [Plakobranchus ocellatus]
MLMAIIILSHLYHYIHTSFSSSIFSCAKRAEAQYNCKKDQFSCQSGRHCLSYTQVCNRHKDCDNNHDERNCDCPTDNAETPLISHVTNTSVTWIVDNKVFSNFSYALLVEGIQSANLSWTQNPPITGKTVTVSGLKAAQAYSFVFKYKDRRCLTSALSAKLEDGLPSAPQNLVVTTQKEKSADPNSVVLVVKVQWKEPASPRGTIKGYVIYYQQINNNGTTASDVFEQWLPVSSGQDLQDTVVTHIERGRTYHFWVAAMTEAGVGEASAKQTVNVSPGPDKSFNPKIKILKEGSVNLLWNAQPEVKGYKVTVEVEDPVARIPEKVFYLDKSSTHQKIRDLCPGSHITVKLAARYGDSQVYKHHDKDVLTFRMDDLSAPPRDVEALTLRQNDVYHVRLTWKTSCGHLIINTSYIVSVQAGEEPEWSFVQAFSPSEDGQISWLFREVSPGVTYKFTVRSDVPGSRPSEQVEVTIPSLDGPINLVMFPEEGHSVMVRWDWPPRKDFPEFKEYILHTSGPDSLSLTNHTSNTEISLALGKDGQYNFTVDIKDKHDRTIAESRQPAIFMYEAHVKQGPDDVSVSRSNLVAILVPVALVVVALSAALVFFIVRHKRLQRSFLAFANSHYNIQSGTTTFSDDLDGDEPLIQGFSDDEPLVIA